MTYETYKLQQQVETYDKYGRPQNEYEDVEDVQICVNTNKIYKKENDQIYTITTPVAICNRVISLQFSGKYRLVSQSHTYSVVSHQISNRFTVFDIVEVE